MPLKKKIRKFTALTVVFFFVFQMFSPSLYAFDTGSSDMHGGAPVGTANPGPVSGTPGDTPSPEKNPSEEADKNQCSAGNPVSLLTGEETHTKADLFIPGRGLDFQIVRTYKSRKNFNGRWGYGWFLNYDVKIKKLENNNLLLVTGKGSKDEYTKSGEGVYDSPQGFDDALTENPDGTFTRTLKNGVEYHFDVNGSLKTLSDRNGNALTFLYDTAGKLPINGKSAFFVSQTTGVIAYDYKLIKVIDTVGREAEFFYNGDGRLAKIIDPAGREIVYEYDADNNLVKAYEPADPSTALSSRDFYSYAYDGNHNLTSVTNPNDIAYLQNEYNDEDRVSRQTLNGEISDFEYDTDARTARLTRGDGSVITYKMNECCGNPTEVVRDAGTGRLNLKRTYTYDDDMNMTSETDPKGNTTYYEYDAEGNVTKVTDAEGGVTRFEYEDTFNQVTRITDALNRSTGFSYDADGNLIRITDAMGNRTDFTYAANGDLLTATNAVGKRTLFTYDAYGNISTVTDALNKTVNMTYDVLGNLLSVRDQNGHETEFAYDVKNQIETIKDALGGILRFTYDKNGNRKTVSDALNHSTTFGYDNYDRLKTVTNALNHVTGFTYDANGNLKTVTDAENNTVAFEYDTWNRKIRSKDAMNRATGYAYDANGNLIRITDAGGNATEYEYDGINRLTKTVFPDGSYETLAYNKVGSLVSKRNRDGKMVSYAYDTLNRLTGVTYPGASQVSYTYDVLSRMTRAVNASDTVQYAYDALNRVTGVTQNGRTVQYAYDGAGNRTKLTYPDGSYVTYVHDALNRLDQIKNASGQVVADYTYDATGRRTQADFLNGTRSVYGYNTINMLTSLNNRAVSPQSVISDFSYVYDKAGNRTSMTAADGVYAYTYDKVYQLTGVNYPAGYPFADVSYPYDAVGNRTAVGSTAYVSNELNQYTAVGGVNFTYDGRGNLTGDGVNGYVYDDENRMIQAQTAGGTVTFTYDAFGRRTEKSGSDGTVFYVYDGDQVIAEYNASGSLLRKFVYGTGIDEPVVMETGGNQYYYHFDGLGSVTELTGSGGGVVERYAYDVFGKVRMTDGVGNALGESGAGNPYYFTGRRLDGETGLYHYRARSYSPELGRFLQVDPVGYLDSLNLYGYVVNNPVNLVDPLGQRGFKIPKIIQGGAKSTGEDIVAESMKKTEDRNMSYTLEKAPINFTGKAAPWLGALYDAYDQHSRGQDVDWCQIAYDTGKGVVFGPIGGVVYEKTLDKIAEITSTPEYREKAKERERALGKIIWVDWIGMPESMYDNGIIGYALGKR